MSAGESGMSPAAVRVKEEGYNIEIKVKIECGASEAASSYAQHEVKRELVLGPERLQPAQSHTPLPAAVYLKEEWVGNDIKMESDNKCGEAVPSLYARHEVKRELVLGPERLQPQDIMYKIRQPLLGAELGHVKQEPVPAEVTCSRDAPRSGKSRGEQLALRTCPVSPKRIRLDKELYTCTICHNTFLQECSLKSHLCIHSAEETSSNIIKSQQVLKVHKKKQSYSCDSCEKEFTYNADFIRHMRIHTGEKPFSCEICKKQFTQLSHLTSHERVHTGEKPYKCQICKKKFSRSSHLATHILIHTGEKPFSCNICNKQFSRKCNLLTHKRIHTGEKSFSCNICEKQFTHSYDLVRHKRIHTGEKPFSCDVCKKQFSQGPNLARHKLIHSADSSETECK